MTQKLFTPKERGEAIEATCSNLAMSKLLSLNRAAGYMERLAEYDDTLLAHMLQTSTALLDEYLMICWSLN